MNGLMKKLTELTDEMTNQECCKNYLKSLQVIKDDESLYEELNTYRRKNVEMHLNRESLREEANLEKQFHSFLMKAPVREFLYWEQKTMEMIRMIHENIDQQLDIDISFF